MGRPQIVSAVVILQGQGPQGTHLSLGSPCQVKVSAMAVQQLPDKWSQLLESVLHVHLLFLHGGGAESAALLLSPTPTPTLEHTHLLPGEGCDECQAASLLQVLPFSLPVEILVPPAAAKKQEVSWGVQGGLRPDRCWGSCGPAPEVTQPGIPALTSLALGHTLLDGCSEGGHAGTRSHHDHRYVWGLREGQAAWPHPQRHSDRICHRREVA